MDPEPGWLPAWGDWEQDPDVVEGQPGTGAEACPSPWSPLWAESHCLATRPWGHPCSAGGLGLPISVAGPGWQPCASGWGRGGSWRPSLVLLPREGRNPPHPIRTSAHRSPDLTCSGGGSPCWNERLVWAVWAAWAALRTQPCLRGKGEGPDGMPRAVPRRGGGLRCNLEVTEEPATPTPPSQSHTHHTLCVSLFWCPSGAQPASCC